METGHKGREVWHQKLFRIINSGISFALAYILLTQIFWMVMGLVGKFFKFDSFVYYFGIKFMLHEHYWNRLNVSLIYSSGPIAVLLLGFLSLSLFHRIKNSRNVVGVFLLWMFVIGTSIFCAQTVVASLGHGQYNSPFYQNFAVVFAWLRFPPVLVYMLNIPFVMMLAYFAVSSCKPFLSVAYSYTKVNKLSRRRKYYVETLMLPFVIGAFITTVLTFPLNFYVHAVYMGIIACFLFIGWYALSYVEVMRDDVLKFKALQSLNPYLILVLAAIIAAVIVTWEGIYLAYH